MAPEPTGSTSGASPCAGAGRQCGDAEAAAEEGDLDRRGVLRLPTTLGEALAAFADDDLVRGTLGDYLTDQLLTVKRAEWQDYRAHVSPWELARYADA